MKSKMAKFATCDLDNRTGVDDCHWIPQSMYTSECDSVLRYESLRSMSTLIGNGSPRSFDDSKGLDKGFFAYAKQLANAEYLAKPFALLKPSKGSTNATEADHEDSCKLTYEDLDDESRRALSIVYKTDFDEFNYDAVFLNVTGGTLPQIFSPAVANATVGSAPSGAL